MSAGPALYPGPPSSSASSSPTTSSGWLMMTAIGQWLGISGWFHLLLVAVLGAFFFIALAVYDTWFEDLDEDRWRATSCQSSVMVQEDEPREQRGQPQPRPQTPRTSRPSSPSMLCRVEEEAHTAADGHEEHICRRRLTTNTESICYRSPPLSPLLTDAAADDLTCGSSSSLSVPSSPTNSSPSSSPPMTPRDASLLSPPSDVDARALDLSSSVLSVLGEEDPRIARCEIASSIIGVSNAAAAAV